MSKRFNHKIQSKKEQNEIMTRKAYLLSKKNASLLKSLELKYIDQFATSVPIGTGPLFYNLNGLTRGASVLERIGDQITLRSIEIHGIIHGNNADPSSSVRMMLINNKAANQVAFDVTQVLENVTATTILVSPRNEDGKPRYSVLSDRIMQFQNVGKNTAKFTIKKKLNLSVRYETNLGTFADIVNNALYLFFVSDASITFPTLTWWSRIYFSDK